MGDASANDQSDNRACLGSGDDVVGALEALLASYEAIPFGCRPPPLTHAHLTRLGNVAVAQRGLAVRAYIAESSLLGIRDTKAGRGVVTYQLPTGADADGVGELKKDVTSELKSISAGLVQIETEISARESRDDGITMRSDHTTLERELRRAAKRLNEVTEKLNWFKYIVRKMSEGVLSFEDWTKEKHAERLGAAVKKLYDEHMRRVFFRRFDIWDRINECMFRAMRGVIKGAPWQPIPLDGFRGCFKDMVAATNDAMHAIQEAKAVDTRLTDPTQNPVSKQPHPSVMPTPPTEPLPIAIAPKPDALKSIEQAEETPRVIDSLAVAFPSTTMPNTITTPDEPSQSPEHDATVGPSPPTATDPIPEEQDDRQDKLDREIDVSEAKPLDQVEDLPRAVDAPPVAAQVAEAPSIASVAVTPEPPTVEVDNTTLKKQIKRKPSKRREMGSHIPRPKARNQRPRPTTPLKSQPDPPATTIPVLPLLNVIPPSTTPTESEHAAAGEPIPKVQNGEVKAVVSILLDAESRAPSEVIDVPRPDFTFPPRGNPFVRYPPIPRVRSPRSRSPSVVTYTTRSACHSQRSPVMVVSELPASVQVDANTAVPATEDVVGETKEDADRATTVEMPPSPVLPIVSLPPSTTQHTEEPYGETVPFRGRVPFVDPARFTHARVFSEASPLSMPTLSHPRSRVQSTTSTTFSALPTPTSTDPARSPRPLPPIPTLSSRAPSPPTPVIDHAASALKAARERAARQAKQLAATKGDDGERVSLEQVLRDGEQPDDNRTQLTYISPDVEKILAARRARVVIDESASRDRLIEMAKERRRWSVDMQGSRDTLVRLSTADECALYRRATIAKGKEKDMVGLPGSYQEERNVLRKPRRERRDSAASQKVPKWATRIFALLGETQRRLEVPPTVDGDVIPSMPKEVNWPEWKRAGKGVAGSESSS